MRAKKLVTMCLALAVIAVFIAVPTAGASATNVWTHRFDASGGAPLQEMMGLSSMNGTGTEVVSSTGAAAFATVPIGKEAFKISFNVIWSPQNKDEGQDGYLDNFLTLWFSDSASFPDAENIPFVHDTGVVPVQFRITNRHTQAVNHTGMDIIKVGIADFGGKTLSTINKQCVSKFYIELSKTQEDTDMLKLWMDDGGTERGVCYFDIGDDIFNTGKTQYLFVGQFGSPYFSIYNVKVEESDIAASEGATLTQWKHLAGTEKPLRELYGLTSANYAGDQMVSWGTAAAFASTPLGKQSFKASFDLTWYTSNSNEGADDYLDNFLALYLSDATTFPNVPNDQGYVTGIADAFRLVNRHAQAVQTGESTATVSAGIVDFGGVQLFDQDMATSTFFLELKNNVLSLWMQDGETVRGNISFTFADGTFDADTPQYLCFAQYNNPKFAVKNLIVHESDIASSVTDFAVDYYTAGGNESSDDTSSDTDDTSSTSGTDVPNTGSTAVLIAVAALLASAAATAFTLSRKARG